MITNRNSRSPEPRGFVLLYAVMTASIVLAVGVSIISIALKQLSIANLGRESQYAFYAANTGAECALYLDFHGVVSASGGAGTYFRRLSIFRNPFMQGIWPEITAPTDVAQVNCARTALMGNPYAPAGSGNEWTESDCGVGYASNECDGTSFTVFLGRDDAGGVDVEGPCAKVTVLKVRGNDPGAGFEFDPDPAGQNLQTVIDSRGYNYCSETNSRRVERGLKFSY